MHRMYLLAVSQCNVMIERGGGTGNVSLFYRGEKVWLVDIANGGKIDPASAVMDEFLFKRYEGDYSLCNLCQLELVK